MGVTNVNTLGITYIHGVIREHHYETIFDKLMEIPESEIEGVDGRCETRFIFKVTSQQRYNDICSRFTGKDIFLERGHTIRVDDISTKCTMVELTIVPFDLSNDHLKILLNKYGNVNKCQSYFHKYGKYSNFSKSGHRIAWIELNDHIPRILNIKETHNFLNVTYHKQPFACNLCGNAGHRARGCKTKPADFINVLDMELLQKKIGDSGSNSVDLDIHVESSQSTNKFACTMCDYKCSYVNILQDHMLCHISEDALPDDNNSQVVSDKNENAFKCFICDTVSLCKKSHDEHLAMHDIEINRSCPECDFECLNEDVLNNHISSHIIYACKVCNYTFKTAKDLSEHGKIHNVGKFNCSECEYTCSSKGELRNHKKQHTGEKTESNKRGLSISPEANVPSKKAALRNKQGNK